MAIMMQTTQTVPDHVFWGLDEVAVFIGVTYNSARTYHGRAEINRRKGAEKTSDMPPPDHKFGRSPVWYPETINEWLQWRRPYVKRQKVGKGAGSDVETTLGDCDSQAG